MSPRDGRQQTLPGPSRAGDLAWLSEPQLLAPAPTGRFGCSWPNPACSHTPTAPAHVRGLGCSPTSIRAGRSQGLNSHPRAGGTGCPRGSLEFAG